MISDDPVTAGAVARVDQPSRSTALEPFRFIFMSDCQLGCYASFSGLDDDAVHQMASHGMTVRVVPRVEGFEWETRRFERAVAMANDTNAAFVVMGGDMVHDPADDDQYAAVMQIAEGLDVPINWVAGNHDVGEDTNVATAGSIMAYRARFGADHYWFDHSGATMVVIDTTVWTSVDTVPDELDRQATALRETLVHGTERPGPILVFGHHPLFIDDPDEPDLFWNIPHVQRRVLLDLFDLHGVTAYFCGHWHRNAIRRHGRLEIAITGPVGYPLGDDPSGFRLVDVTADGILHAYVPLTEVDPLP